MHGGRFATDRTAEIAAALLLVAAMLLGGGPRGAGDAVVHLASLPCIALAVIRWRAAPVTPLQRWFGAGLLLALGLVALQLLPLPPALWSRLPGRTSLVADLQAAGLAVGWRPMTLDLLGTVRALIAVLVFAAMAMLAITLPHASRIRLLQLALAVAVLQALLGFAQAAAGTHSPLRFHDYHHPIGAIGTFANRNHFANLMAMLAPLALAVGVDAGRQRQRPMMAVWIGASLLLFLAAALSFSRAGFALAFALMIASLLVLLGRATARSRWLALAAFAGLGALAVGTYAWDGLAQRLAQDPLDDLRWQYVRYGWGAAREYLPWGSGLGSFPWVYAAIEPVEAMTHVYAERAHNDLLQIAVESGVPGLLLAAGFVAVVTVVSIRSFPIGSTPRLPDDSLGRVMAFAVWVPLLHSLVDYPLRTYAIAVPLALLLSSLSGVPEPAAPRRGR